VSGTLLFVHCGHKTCAGQTIEQVLLIDTVKMVVLTGYPRFGSIVLALGQIEYCSNSATFT
jgi:hypothetical protein